MTHPDFRPDFLPPALGPGRTYALVAGVESYAVSHNWNLRGPAQDALRFAQWLTGPAEVPAANVRLLLSPLDGPDSLDWAEGPGPAALRAACRPATEANVKAALLDELPQCEGDLLWIYWAGHGFLGDRQELMLPCADATPGQIRHLNLDSALRWWRTNQVERHRFRLQAALVDACRVDAPAQWNFGSNDYGGGSGVPGRRQFRLFASREGEAAKNDSARRVGPFTEALLDELGTRSLRDSVTALPAVARTIHLAFEEKRERGEGWQLPQFVVDRDWDASSFLPFPGLPEPPGRPEPPAGATGFPGDDGHPGAALPGPRPPRATRLDQAGWDGLGTLFAGRDLPRCAYEAYAWAFRAAGCTTPPDGGLPGDTLLDVVQDLDERQGGATGIPLVVPFVRFLAHRAGPGDAPWAAGLGAWVHDTRRRLALPPLPPPPDAPRPTALHVRLETPPGGEDGYRARMWLRREVTRNIWESEGDPVRLDVVRAELLRQLAAVAAASGEHAGADAGQPYEIVERIEFHVPYELLETDFDQWPVPRGPGRTRPLGAVYPVVVRCPQEREYARAEWRTKWHWMWTQGGKHARTVRVVEDREVTDTLGMELGAGPAPACVLGHTSAARTAGLLEAVLEGGVPVAVWRPGTGAPEGGLDALLAPDGGGTPHAPSLPGRVREVRRAAAGGAGRTGEQPEGGDRLVLLWDDPDDTPDLRSLV